MSHVSDLCVIDSTSLHSSPLSYLWPLTVATEEQAFWESLCQTFATRIIPVPPTITSDTAKTCNVKTSQSLSFRAWGWLRSLSAPFYVFLYWINTSDVAGMGPGSLRCDSGTKAWFLQETTKKSSKNVGVGAPTFGVGLLDLEENTYWLGV